MLPRVEQVGLRTHKITVEDDGGTWIAEHLADEGIEQELRSFHGLLVGMGYTHDTIIQGMMEYALSYDRSEG